ncbi:MAG: hypothetical protein RL497_2886 [Pseudomonadota bacterium]
MAINVGGPAYTAANGVTYIADRYFTGGTTENWRRWGVTDVAGTSDDAIFLDERWGNFQYSIPDMPNGVYEVTLQFNELNWHDTGDRKISTVIEGVQVLKDFDIYARVGNAVALSLPFDNIQVRDGVLNIGMTASVDSGSLSGIVVKRIASIAVSNTDAIAPSVPSGLVQSEVLDSKLSLKWNASTDNTGVVGYYVYRNGQQLVYVSSQVTSYTDQGLQPNTAYSYSVSAVDGYGNRSALSAEIAVKTYILAGALYLSWEAPLERENGERVYATDIGGYAVRYKLRNSSTYKTLTLPPSANEYTFPAMTGDYDFEIAVYDTNGVYSEYVKIPL